MKKRCWGLRIFTSCEELEVFQAKRLCSWISTFLSQKISWTFVCNSSPSFCTEGCQKSAMTTWNLLGNLINLREFLWFENWVFFICAQFLKIRFSGGWSSSFLTCKVRGRWDCVYLLLNRLVFTRFSTGRGVAFLFGLSRHWVRVFIFCSVSVGIMF